MSKKLYLLFSLVIVCLLFVYGLNEKPTEELESVNINLVEETETVEAKNINEAIVLSVNEDVVLVYNYSTEQVEEYQIQDFYYQESLFFPSKGALIKYESNIWNVYWTREAQEYYK